MQERPSLAFRLSGLSELELNLAAAIGRVRMRTSGFKGSLSANTVTSSNSSARAEGTKGINGRNKASKTITVEDAMNEFHRLSSIVTRKVRDDSQKHLVCFTILLIWFNMTVIALQRI